MSSNGDAAPSAPRLCHLVISPDFKGYGFNLHTVKEKPGQFIGQVDEGSPAAVADLRQGDRILEVNGANIANENHTQVVARIKKVSGTTTLLVVDSTADAWYKKHNIVVSSDMPEVVRNSSVPTKESRSPSPDHRSEDRRSVASAESGSSAVNSVTSQEERKESTSSAEQEESSDDEEEEEETAPSPQPQKEESDEEESEEESEDEIEEVKKPVVAVSSQKADEEERRSSSGSESVEIERHEEKVQDVERRSVSSSSSSEVANSVSTGRTKSPASTSPSPPPSANFPTIPGLNINMSAAEMRAYLAAKKKRDIRHVEIDMKKKHEIIQKL